jgi:5-methylcytosine-specific restriction protein B
MADLDREQLYQQFQEVFPLETLKDMPLEKYTNLNKDDSFCYWLESRTYYLGSFWGGSSYMFGIYKYNKRPNENDPRIQSDDTYAWYAKYGKATADEAYELVRDTIITIAEHARNGELDAIDKIDIFGDSFKWKIAFLYSDRTLIPIYKREMLEVVATEFGMDEPKKKSIPYIQRFLMLKKGDVELYDFYDKLLAILEKHNSQNTFETFKTAFIERIETDGKLKIFKPAKNYLRVGSNDGVIGTMACHYKIITDTNKKAGHQKGRIYVEIHCEGKKYKSFKELSSIEGLKEFVWSKYGVRLNDEGWNITSNSIEELVDCVVNELYKLNDLCSEMIHGIMLGTHKRYWIYAPGEGASKWQQCQDDKIMCIGWEEMGDLSVFNSLDEIKSKMQEVYDKPDASFVNDGLALWEFVHVIKPGDIVYAKQGKTKIVGRGTVKGDYRYDDKYDSYNNVREVDWTHIGEWKAPHESVTKTLTDIAKYPSYVKDLEALFQDNSNRHYWWLVANPKIWSFGDMKVGEVQDYTLYNNNGNRRRIFQNFLDAKEGDVVIGYESTPTKQIIALVEVAKANNGKLIHFRKTESLPVPIDYSTIKGIPELAEMEYLKNPQGSFYKLTEDEFNILIDVIREDNPVKVEQKNPTYNEEDFLKNVYLKREQYHRLKALLLTKKNIILQGAPGVGKTFSAKQLAYSVMGEVDKSRVEFVQFHQSYTYEDFVMGYKPNEEGGFYLKRGVFYNFCKKAKADPERKYFFIIDEINRGNLSKIFGELLMLIEKDYRDDAIKLAYSDETFDVPNNLYIIGMMNSADRSLAMIDYALRRRFSFFDMKPGFESIGFCEYQKQLHSDLFDKIVEGVVALNEVIAKDDSLGQGFCIGHSYFCNQTIFTEEWIRNVIDYDILPMLREYWFDNDNQYEQQSAKLKALLK